MHTHESLHLFLNMGLNAPSQKSLQASEQSLPEGASGSLQKSSNEAMEITHQYLFVGAVYRNSHQNTWSGNPSGTCSHDHLERQACS
jgi:hypothetical protein